MIDTTIRKNTKATITCLKKKGRLSVCLHMQFKYELKFQIEIRKIERGIAVMPLVLITCLMYRNPVFGHIYLY